LLLLHTPQVFDHFPQPKW